jgi:two-component system cell cycle response regulator DivK
MRKILIVEDNVDLLVVLKEVLSADYEVVTARRGEDAVTLARSHRPDLVILDLQLPAMDGIEAGRWIKKELAPANVPILVLTALADEGDSQAVLDSGCCDAYMSKPAPLDKIRGKVRELLERGRAA